MLIKHWNIKIIKLSPIGMSLALTLGMGSFLLSAAAFNVLKLHYVVMLSAILNLAPLASIGTCSAGFNPGLRLVVPLGQRAPG